MKISELVHRSKEDLEKLQHDLGEELRKLRFDTVLSSLGNPARLRLARRELAQVKTLLREYQLGIRNYEKSDSEPSKKRILFKKTRKKKS